MAITVSVQSKISPAFVARGVGLLPTCAFRRDGGGGGGKEALSQFQLHREINAKRGSVSCVTKIASMF